MQQSDTTPCLELAPTRSSLHECQSARAGRIQTRRRRGVIRWREQNKSLEDSEECPENLRDRIRRRNQEMKEWQTRMKMRGEMMNRQTWFSSFIPLSLKASSVIMFLHTRLLEQQTQCLNMENKEKREKGTLSLIVDQNGNIYCICS